MNTSGLIPQTSLQILLSLYTRSGSGFLTLILCRLVTGRGSFLLVDDSTITMALTQTAGQYSFSIWSDHRFWYCLRLISSTYSLPIIAGIIGIEIINGRKIVCILWACSVLSFLI